MLGASVCADGASAAIVSAKEPGDYASMIIDSMDTMLAPEGEADMAWTIGDNGFEMVLSSYVPKILESNIEATMSQLLSKADLEKNDVDFWAVHPGGRAILDKIRDGMSIPESMLIASRSVLNDYGNLSSATILFVLKEYLDNSFIDAPMRGVAMAFGPGLTIESATLTLVPALTNATF
jgi:predicted naringenin-chalcone synthase